MSQFAFRFVSHNWTSVGAVRSPNSLSIRLCWISCATAAVCRVILNECVASAWPRTLSPPAQKIIRCVCTEQLHNYTWLAEPPWTTVTTRMRVRCVCRPLDPLSAVTCPSETSAESQLPAVTVGAGGERPNRIILSYGETIFSGGYTLHPASRSPPLQIRTERNETPSVHPFSPVPNNYYTTDRQTDRQTANGHSNRNTAAANLPLNQLFNMEVEIMIKVEHHHPPDH